LGWNGGAVRDTFLGFCDVVTLVRDFSQMPRRREWDVRSDTEESDSTSHSPAPDPHWTSVGLQDRYTAPPGRRTVRKDIASAEKTAVERQLRAVLKSDRELARRFEREADSIAKEASRVRESQEVVLQQVRHERRESERLRSMREKLSRDLLAAKGRLTDLSMERRSIAEGDDTQRDRAHFARECAHMRDTVEEEERMLTEARRTNRLLEESCKRALSGLEQLRKEHKEVVEQKAKEEELEKIEARELQQLRRDPDTVAGLHPGVDLDVRSSRGSPPNVEPQDLWASPGSASRGLWASSLVGGGPSLSPRPLSSAGEVPGSSRGMSGHVPRESGRSVAWSVFGEGT